MGEGITLFWVVQVIDITPEPDEDERKAILAALDEETATQSGASGWAASATPVREGENGPPYP
jgi:hypothetical protein